METPKTTGQWIMRPRMGLDGLRFDEEASIPALSETACLVKIEAVSLNYRDVAITFGGYPMPTKDEFVPTSDGAGSVVAVGANVKSLKVGDKVCTLFHQGFQSGLFTTAVRKTSLGTQVDGPLREYAVYDETGLVLAPQSTSFNEAATLPCAALTAWNALTGLSDRSVQSGDHVLVQGTGGVSLFAAQFAVAAGATVIGTTSSDSKAGMLKDLGVAHVINYRSDPNWGETAKSLTPGGEGMHHIIEVGGESTMAQSLKAIRPEGVISIIGFLGGKEAGEQKSSYSETLTSSAIVRGISVGSREQFVAMNTFIGEHTIKAIIDSRIFQFREAKEAYQYLLDAKHVGKVVISVGANAE